MITAYVIQGKTGSVYLPDFKEFHLLKRKKKEQKEDIGPGSLD